MTKALRSFCLSAALITTMALSDFPGNRGIASVFAQGPPKFPFKAYIRVVLSV